MQAVAHNAKFAAKVGIPQKVGEEFNAADEARKGGLAGVLAGGAKPYNAVKKKGVKRMYDGSGSGGA